MDFPPYAPSSREYTDGNWPIQTYKSLSGQEVRVLYGSKQTSMRLRLTYQNLQDTEAQTFLQHFQQQLGSFTPFQFGGADGPKKGWGGDPRYLGVAARSSNWIYEESPTVTSVRPGVSTVTVNLRSVLAS